jgi:DNA-binding SARP family transcriptional activator
MDFRVLGPLEIRDDNSELVELAQPLHRAALSVLLLCAGTPCSYEKLIGALWADAPPKDPLANLFNIIHRIRGLLDLGDLLKTLPGGAYQLNPGPGALDLHLFQLRTARAREAQARGDLRQEAALLAAALECWRDPPLFDVPSAPGIDADVRRLLGQRQAAETRLVDLMLAVGRHQDLVDLVTKLRSALIDDPLDEYKWGQLMLALYRIGQKAKALAAYGKARTTLMTELGTKPGEELRDLMQAILADSKELRRPSPPGPRGSHGPTQGWPLRDAPAGGHHARLPHRPGWWLPDTLAGPDVRERLPAALQLEA